MESALGASFADVRIHVGPHVASMGATSFTHGSNIHFAPGHYQTVTLHGQQVLAHELVHVVQQRSGRVRNPFNNGVAVVHDRLLEAEAERVARAVMTMPACAQPHVAQPAWPEAAKGLVLGGGLFGLGALTLGASWAVTGAAAVSGSILGGWIGYNREGQPVTGAEDAAKPVAKAKKKKHPEPVYDLIDTSGDAGDDDEISDEQMALYLKGGQKPKPKPKPSSSFSFSSGPDPYPIRKQRALREIQGEIERCAKDKRYHYNRHHFQYTIQYGPYDASEKADIRTEIQKNLAAWAAKCQAAKVNVLHGKAGKGENFNVGAWDSRGGMILNLHFVW